MEGSCVEEDMSESLRHRVYFAARDGMPLTMYNILKERTHQHLGELLNQSVKLDGVSCTPLVAAARHGHDGTVKILLEHFKPFLNLEAEATVRFEEYVISGATALWAAAGAGHLKIVKRLVQAGAQLNHATSTSSTPLRAACFDGRLDIVRFLVKRGADVHKPNQYNNTCLMIAAYKGHIDVVRYLLSQGAKVNEKAHCGATALHFAAECGHVSVVKELIDHGAELSPNEHGMTALMCAAERTRASVVELLVTQPCVSREDAIQAMELLGASYANDKEYYCLPLAFQYMRRSMEMRQGASDRPPIPRVPAPPIPAYNNWRECRTLEELDSYEDNAAALHMEGLAVRERVLGRACPELPHPIVFRGAVFADDARFDRCLALWEHALTLRQENNVPVVKDLLRFAQVFSQMIHIGIELSLKQVWTILDGCSLELIRNREKINNPGPKDDPDNLLEELESNIRTALYLVAILGKLLITKESHKLTPKEEKDKEVAYGSVYRVVNVGARQRDGQTLLHLTLNPSTPVDEFHTNDVCKFPCVVTCRLLLECGADANVQDSRHATPLHYAAQCPTLGSTIPRDLTVEFNETIHAVASPETMFLAAWELLHHGAHPDVVDDKGKTPLDYYEKGGPVESVLRGLLPLRLCCLAARVCSNYNIPYRGIVPSVLTQFIQLHGHKG